MIIMIMLMNVATFGSHSFTNAKITDGKIQADTGEFKNMPGKTQDTLEFYITTGAEDGIHYFHSPQEAVDSAASAASADTFCVVNVEPGTYAIDTTLNIGSDYVVLKGRDRDACIFDWGSYGWSGIYQKTPQSVLNVQGLTIRGKSLDTAIYASSAGTVYISDVTIDTVGIFGVYIGIRTDVTLRNILVRNATTAGIRCSGSGTVNIKDCEVDSANYAAYLRDCGNVKVQGCKLAGKDNAAYTQDNDSLWIYRSDFYSDGVSDLSTKAALYSYQNFAYAADCNIYIVGTANQVGVIFRGGTSYNKPITLQRVNVWADTTTRSYGVDGAGELTMNDCYVEGHFTNAVRNHGTWTKIYNTTIVDTAASGAGVSVAVCSDRGSGITELLLDKVTSNNTGGAVIIEADDEKIDSVHIRNCDFYNSQWSIKYFDRDTSVAEDRDVHITLDNSTLKSGGYVLLAYNLTPATDDTVGFYARECILHASDTCTAWYSAGFNLLNDSLWSSYLNYAGVPRYLYTSGDISGDTVRINGVALGGGTTTVKQVKIGSHFAFITTAGDTFYTGPANDSIF